MTTNGINSRNDGGDLPPQLYSMEAESAVIGALLIDNASYAIVSEAIDANDFYTARNRVCYEAVVSLFRTGQPFDVVTVVETLGRAGRLEAAGGVEYLSTLAEATPTSLSAGHYAAIIADYAARRRISDAGRAIYEMGQTQTRDSVEQVFSDALDQLFRIRPTVTASGLVPLSSLLDRYLQGDDADSVDEYGTPIMTGYPDLDQLLNGMQRSDLLIVGARPGMGKSSLAFNICVNAARDGATAAIFSLEMSNDQVARRILSSESGIPATRILQNLYTEPEYDTMVNVIGEVSGMPIYVDDSPYQTVTDMRSKAQRLQMERGLDFIVVDYLQLINGSRNHRRGSRVETITEISRDLKGMARDLKLPVLACSQLSRNLENRPTHRPVLSDLRDSGSIEQDADVVIFLHREDKFTGEDEWLQQYPGQTYPKNIAEIIIAKHRHGPTGQFGMFFRESVMRFENISLQDTDAAASRP